MRSNDQRQFALREETMTREQYGLKPEHYQLTWFDAELKKRADARRAEADVNKVEAGKPRRRLVRRSR
jgi:hypothetical protein